MSTCVVSETAVDTAADHKTGQSPCDVTNPQGSEEAFISDLCVVSTQNQQKMGQQVERADLEAVWNTPAELS